MSLRQRRVRKPLSITSLIDVIFLLLLFFMLASTFSKFSELELSGVAAAGAGTPDQSPDPTQIMALLVGDSSLTLDGEALQAPDLVAKIEQKLPQSPQLTLTVTEQTSTQRLTDVLAILEPVDGLMVTMVAPS